jgi:hypothetical protein
MKIIGRDVIAYTWTTGIGTINMLGRWNRIEVRLKRAWSEVTTSEAEEPSRRPQIIDWSATCSGFIDGSGSSAFFAFMSSVFAIVAFEDVVSGAGCILRGGIDMSSATWEGESAKDELSLIAVGREAFTGLPSFEYGGILVWPSDNTIGVS